MVHFLLKTVIFATLVSFSTSKCPQGCDCSTDGMYDCSSKQLTTMVNVTDDNIRTLDLRNNSIKMTTVLDAPYLTYLSLANNSVHTLMYDTFDNLDELKTLVLSNNSIGRITDDIFEWNPLKLEVLSLDGNQLEFIQHFLLYDLEELSELYLQNNFITFIHPHAFLHLKKLRTIRLDNNHLHTFESRWLRGLKANMFEMIRFDQNPWSCDCAMEPNLKWMKKTKWFTKMLKHHDMVCQEPNNEKGKPILKLKGSLQCDKPDIIGISEKTTLYTNQSIELDCVVDPKKYPYPQLMWIAPNKDRYNLQTADRFEGIEVFQNGSIIIHRVQVNDSGDYICVATSNKTSVQAKTTLTVKKRDKYVTVSPTLEKPVSQAAVDKKFVNHSTSCPKHCSCISQHVECVSDNGVGITDIPYDDIPHLTKTLSFSPNQIKRVKVFKLEYPHLTELRLDNNEIETIDNKAFDTLTSLQTLTMRDNKISTLPPKLFKNLKKLTILVLDNNQLTYVNDKTFYGLSSLQWLYVRNNYIANVSRHAFAKTTKVRFIHMEGNQLSSLKPQTVTTLTQPKSGGRIYIQKIFVDENLFQCDCHLEGMRLFVQENSKWDSLFGDGLQCSFPPKYHEKYLQEVNATLTCNYTSVARVSTVGGNDGGRNCHFPFEFDKKIYYKCIRVDGSPFNGKTWCATTSSYTQDGLWGECNTSDFSIVKISTNSSTMSGLWFGGLALGFIVCGVGFFLYRKYGHKMGMKSMQYSNLPGYDTTEEHRSLTTNASGSEAFV